MKIVNKLAMPKQILVNSVCNLYFLAKMFNVNAPTNPETREKLEIAKVFILPDSRFYVCTDGNVDNARERGFLYGIVSGTH